MTARLHVKGNRGGRGDRGSAVVEFVLFAVVAIVPLAWVALSLQQLVAVHHATQAAAGESLRAFLTAHSQRSASDRADVAAGLVLADHPAVTGYDVQVACGAPRCLQPGAAVRVVVTVQASLPAVPVLGIRPRLATQAQQYGVVDAFVAAR